MIAKQRTSVAHWGADRFARLLCPIISHDEQLRVAERLRAVDGLIDKELLNVEKSRKRKLGLMQDLLTGKVQVKVPTPEPEPA